MARLARVDVGPSSYSSSSYTTKHISLEEALRLVLSGSMGSYELYSQAPKQIKELLDEISDALFGLGFQKSDRKQQNNVCETLLNFQKPIVELLQQIADGKMNGGLFYKLASQDLRDALNKASHEIFNADFVSLWKKEQSEVCAQLLSRQQLTFHDILELVARGELEGRTFYDQIPAQLREIFDGISQAAFQKTFSKLDKKEQSEVCKILLDSVSQVTMDANPSEINSPSSQINAKIETGKTIEESSKETAQSAPPRKGIVQRIKGFVGWS